MNLFTAPETLPFGVAVALIVAVALLEGLGMLVALSPSNVIDDLLPHAVPESGLDRVLGWLHLGRVPALVLLLIFLLGYALFGYALQKVAFNLIGNFLPAWVAWLLAVVSLGAAVYFAALWLLGFRVRHFARFESK